MELVILFGPQAVGKMTVGQELAKQTGFKLFHNHMTIDLVSNFLITAPWKESALFRCSGRRFLRLWQKAIYPV